MSIETTVSTSTAESIGVAEAAAELRALLRPPSPDKAPTPSKVEANAASSDVASDYVEDAEQPQAEIESETPEEFASEDEVEAAEESTEEAEEASSLPAKVTVTIDGKSEEVELEEVIKGYQRQSDYSRKTQALAEERKGFEAKRQEVAAKEQRLGHLLPQVESFLSANAPQPPPESLRNSDPGEYAARWTEYQRHQEALRWSQMEQARLAQQADEERASTMQAQAQAEREKLHEAVPAWRDTARWHKDRAALIEHGKARGFSEEELVNAVDHRAILLLRDSLELARMKAGAPKPKPAAPPSSPPALRPGGGAKVNPDKSNSDKVRARFERTGSVSDAVALMRQTLRPKG